MANAGNAHLLTTSKIGYYASFFAHYVELCAYAHRHLLCSKFCGHNVASLVMVRYLVTCCMCDGALLSYM